MPDEIKSSFQGNLIDFDTSKLEEPFLYGVAGATVYDSEGEKVYEGDLFVANIQGLRLSLHEDQPSTESDDGLTFDDGSLCRVSGKPQRKTVPLMLIEDHDPHGKGMEKLKGSPCHISEIEGFVEMLEPRAREIYNTRRASTIIEMNRPHPKKAGVMLRDFRACQYLCKPVVMKDESGPPQEAIDWLADAFNLLARNEMVDFGILAPAMWLRMKDLPDGTKRALVMLYTFPSFKVHDIAEKKGEGRPSAEYDYIDQERIILNDFLKCVAFAPEGEMGDSTWPAIPK